jgi:hypothetical protein
MYRSSSRGGIIPLFDKDTMISASQSPTPNVEHIANRPKRILWKWTIAIVAIGFFFLIWQLGSGLYSGAKLSDTAVQHFHNELNNGQYDEICREGDEGFHLGERHDDLLRFLQGTRGTFLTAQYNSHISLKGRRWRRLRGVSKGAL